MRFVAGLAVDRVIRRANSLRSAYPGSESQGQIARPAASVFRHDEVMRLRAEEISWRKIAHVLDVPLSTEIDSFRHSASSCDSIERCKYQKTGAISANPEQSAGNQ